MARLPNPRQRVDLLEAAARLLVVEGPSALTTRRLAAEIGASTMAIYTAFGGKDGLITELTREGFRRFSDFLAAVPATDEPVEDLRHLARAYRAFAVQNPHFYRLLFGGSSPVVVLAGDDLQLAQGTFLMLVATVERVARHQRVELDAFDTALQVWAGLHGVVSLEIVCFPLVDEALFERYLDTMTTAVVTRTGERRPSPRPSPRAVPARGGRRPPGSQPGPAASA